MFNTPILTIIIMGSFLFWSLPSMIANTFMPIRSFFAWSFDRLMPEGLANVNERTHSPVNAILVTNVIIAALVIWSVYGNQFQLVLGLIVLAGALAVIIVGLAAVALPIRRPDLYQASPANVKFLGIPVLYIVGTLSIAEFVGIIAISFINPLSVMNGNRDDWWWIPAFSAPKGVPDYIPPDSAQFVAVRDGLLGAARRAGYRDVELPIFEDTALFARGVGESTDVVSKEMYTFNDRGDRSVTLRPEGTAGVVRAVIEHGLDRGALPVKLCYAGPFFRYERPQAGRYRQLQQVGVEAIGVDDPALDAEVIAVADAGFRSLGLDGFRLEITSLGDESCRPQYRELLQDFLFQLDLDEATRRRAEINPLRVLDDKRPEVRAMTADAPVLLDHLSDVAKQHFDTVLAHLDALGVPYVLNPRMVRGLDYYTKTTFEFVHDGLGAQSGIGGGGRYDGLMRQLGGQDLSGIGFGLGVDRTLLALRAEGKSVGETTRCDVFGVPLSEPAKLKLAVLAGQLRAAGVRVDMAYGDRGLKGAMRAADRSGARIALVVGDRDLEAGTVGVKDLATGDQVSVPTDSVVAEVLSQLPR